MLNICVLACLPVCLAACPALLLACLLACLPACLPLLVSVGALSSPGVVSEETWARTVLDFAEHLALAFLACSRRRSTCMGVQEEGVVGEAAG